MSRFPPAVDTARPGGYSVRMFDPEFLVRLANARMPFGKYSGRLLIDLPEAYVVWFSNKGWPEGELGLMLASLYDIKANGLEGVVRPLVRERRPWDRD